MLQSCETGAPVTFPNILVEAVQWSGNAYGISHNLIVKTLARQRDAGKFGYGNGDETAEHGISACGVDGITLPLVSPPTGAACQCVPLQVIPSRIFLDSADHFGQRGIPVGVVMRF